MCVYQHFWGCVSKKYFFPHFKFTESLLYVQEKNSLFKDVSKSPLFNNLVELVKEHVPLPLVPVVKGLLEEKIRDASGLNEPKAAGK